MGNFLSSLLGIGIFIVFPIFFVVVNYPSLLYLRLNKKYGKGYMGQDRLRTNNSYLLYVFPEKIIVFTCPFFPPSKRRDISYPEIDHLDIGTGYYGIAQKRILITLKSGEQMSIQIFGVGAADKAKQKIEERIKSERPTVAG